jgi:MFS family permease
MKKKDLKWNFFVGVMHGILFNGGVAFSSTTTVIPAFLNMLTPSSIVIGFSYMIMGKGRGILGVIPQLFVANKLEASKHKKPLLIKVITVRAVSWGLLALSTALFAKTHPTLMVWILISLLGLFTFMGGVAAIPFSDIFGKAIPSELRGRFFGLRGLLGGIFTIIAGLIVKKILQSSNIVFPKNFALIFFLSFLFVSASYIFLAMVREPEEEVHKDTLPFSVFLKKAYKILKEDRNFRNFLLMQIFVGASSLSLPFYVIYAKNILHFSGASVGTFLTIQMVGFVLSNLLWAYISDYKGNRLVVVLTAITGLFIPAIALISKNNFILFSLTFLFIGIMFSGMSVGFQNFMLDQAKPKERPTYIGLNGTLTFPVLTYSLIGGLLARIISYRTIFQITFIFVLIGFLISLKLKEKIKLKVKNF